MSTMANGAVNGNAVSTHKNPAISLRSMVSSVQQLTAREAPDAGPLANTCGRPEHGRGCPNGRAGRTRMIDRNSNFNVSLAARWRTSAGAQVRPNRIRHCCRSHALVETFMS
jgi:hypothetical protein